MEYENIINVAVKHVPVELIEDARQAGYVGLLKGLKSSSISINNDGYLYRCARNEVMNEMARLHRPFALNFTIYNKLLKYKRLKRFNIPGCFTKTSIDELELLLLTKQRSY